MWPCRSMRSTSSSRMPESSSAISIRISLDVQSLLYVHRGDAIRDQPQVRDAVRLGDDLVDAPGARLVRIDPRAPASHEHEARGRPILADFGGHIPPVLAGAQPQIGDDQLERLLAQALQR